MKRMTTTCLLALLAAAPLAAQQEPEAPCADLGFDNAYLTGFFCGRIAEIAGGGTRSLGDPPEGDPGALDAPDWMQIDALAEAYRVDPQRTLELIDRIRNAGGLPPR